MNAAAPVQALLDATALGVDWDDATRAADRVEFELDRGNQPSPLKSYPGVATRRLSRALPRSPLPAVDVLSGVKPLPEVLDEDRLGAILFLADGVTRGRRSSAGAPVWFRTAMSAGNLHPLELYVIDRGVWHYDPLVHRLELVRSSETTGTLDAKTLVITGIPARTCWKYAARGFRHVFWDAGTLLANLLAAADAYGISASVSLGFDDAAVGALLGITAPDEVPLALVNLGSTEPDLNDRGLGPAAIARPLSRAPIRFDLVTAALEASCVSAAEIEPWRTRLRDLTRFDPGVSTPPPSFGGATIEDVILRRGATRQFRAQSGSRLLASWLLEVGASASPLDVGSSGTHVGQLIHVHDVDGAESGIWNDAGARRLVSSEASRPLRERSARCCLNQDLGGASSLTVFVTAELDQLFERGGGRAFRVAGIEAGIVAGRLALAATALGAGATGLTFVDELIAAELEGAASGLLACAVGTPTAPPAPHGSPGTPHWL